MENVAGFLLINIYAFLLIISTTIVFFSKQRLRQFEDETYKAFLISNIFISLSGLILGLAVMPSLALSNFIIVILNKIYLIALLIWITIMTFYYMYITLKDKIDKKKYKNIFTIIGLISTILIMTLPLTVDITEKGAIATGPSIMFTYTMFGIGFLLQIICVLLNKNYRSKKNIPLYLLIFLGTLVLVSMMLNPSLNYIINPAFIFIAFIMYHTIENPDMQMIETLLRNRELVEETVNDKSNFLFKVSQEIKKPVKNIIDNSKIYKNLENQEDKEKILEKIEQDANNAYFIINDITNITSTDVKKIKIQENSYITKKLFKELEITTKNNLSIAKKEENIKFTLRTYNSYPEKLNGDYIKLKQILLSVISNSIKYTEKGFIDIEIDTITRYDICRMVFTIKDSGCGMNVSKVNELLSSTNKINIEEFEKNDTLELEMPLVIKILKMIGGSISITSEENKGTIVVIVIDQKIDSTKTEDSIKDAKKYSKRINSKKRVFIADDAENLEKIKKQISKYEIDAVTTLIGQEVIEKIQSGDKYELIILKDDMSPDNAYTILKKLQEIKKFDTPVIIAISKEKEFIKEHFIKDGFEDCIIVENLENEIERICKKYL